MSTRSAARSLHLSVRASRKNHLRTLSTIPRPHSSLLPSDSRLVSPRPPFRVPAGIVQQATLPQGARTFTSASPSEGSSSANLTEDEYNELADRDMDVLHESIEILCEEYGPPEWEVEYSSGVMTIRLPPYGTYVINKQPPNQQIWISSPLSGPSRFGWDATNEAWTHHRKSEVTLGKILDQEIRQWASQSGIDSEGWEGTGLN